MTHLPGSLKGSLLSRCRSPCRHLVTVLRLWLWNEAGWAAGLSPRGVFVTLVRSHSSSQNPSEHSTTTGGSGGSCWTGWCQTLLQGPYSYLREKPLLMWIDSQEAPAGPHGHKCPSGTEAHCCHSYCLLSIGRKPWGWAWSALGEI